MVVSAATAPGISTERPSGRHSPSSRLTRFTAGPIAAEIQPVGGTDIAPQHLAEMQRRAEGQRRQPLRPPDRIEMGHAGTRGDDRAQRRLSTPSPMNFSTSPPKACTAPATRSNQAWRVTIIAAGSVASESGEAAQIG